MDLGPTFLVASDAELAPDEQTELSKRVESLKSSTANVAQPLLSDASAKVDAAKVEHASPASRMAATKRRAGRGGKSVAAGGAG
eukprot:8529134-Pyramimonas_sp.AAC.1